MREQTNAAATQGMITELGVEGIRVDDEEKLPRYIGGVLARMQEVWVGRQVAEVKSWKSGIKTVYYVRSLSGEVKDDCVSCSG